MRRCLIAEACPQSESVPSEGVDSRAERERVCAGASPWGLGSVVVSGNGDGNNSAAGHGSQAASAPTIGQLNDSTALDGGDLVQRPRYLRPNPPPLDPARVGMIGVIVMPSGRSVACAIGRDGVAIEGPHFSAADAQAALDASRFVEVRGTDTELRASERNSADHAEESIEEPSGVGPGEQEDR